MQGLLVLSLLGINQDLQQNETNNWYQREIMIREVDYQRGKDVNFLKRIKQRWKMQVRGNHHSCTRGGQWQYCGTSLLKVQLILFARLTFWYDAKKGENS